MVKFQRPAVKEAARTTLEHTGSNPKRLVLIHTGAVLLVTFLLTVLDYLLEQKIGSTGGLGGIATRSTLSTVQAILRYVQILALPAWNCGYLLVCLGLSRQEQAQDRSLLAGFQRFGPVFRLTLLKAAIYLLVAFFCIQITSTVFMLTPWAQTLTEALKPMLESGEADPEAILAAAEAVALPIALIFSGIFLLASIPVFYFLRLTDFCIMDEPRKGAFAALLESIRLTRGHKMALLKLDLSFCWFYALDLLVSALCYGDYLCAFLGISLPWSADVSYFVFLALYAVAQLGLYTWKKNYVYLTYAHAYNTLLT